MNSILDTIKKMHGYESTDTTYDTDFIVHINTALMALTQMGIGPATGFAIADKDDEWDDFIDPNKVEAVKTYIYCKVKLVFDPPASSVVVDALNRTISECEWRITNN